MAVWHAPVGRCDAGATKKTVIWVPKDNNTKQKKNGPSWRFRFYDLDGVERTRAGFRTKAEMRAAMHEVESELRNSTYVAPELGEIEFGDLAAYPPELDPRSTRPKPTLLNPA